MAYCRAGKESDVYMFLGGMGYEFYHPKLPGGDRDGFFTPDIKEALAHFHVLRAAGYKFPQHAIDRLNREIAEMESDR